MAQINGGHKGRTADGEATLFSGTRVGLQDLAVASAVVELAVENASANQVGF